MPTLGSAHDEIAAALAPGMFSRALLDDSNQPVAWIAVSKSWGRVWEIQPLIVAVAHQRRGYGRQLVDAVERHVAFQGGLTMWVGTSDTTGATSVSGADLYQDPFTSLATIAALRPHPFRFWQSVGYRIVGVVPDAEGPGQPSICLAKRVGGPG